VPRIEPLDTDVARIDTVSLGLHTPLLHQKENTGNVPPFPCAFKGLAFIPMPARAGACCCELVNGSVPSDPAAAVKEPEMFPCPEFWLIERIIDVVTPERVLWIAPL
jgi:hypothetical protein